MRKIVGQVIALTKNIWLTRPTKERGYRAQFFVGAQRPFMLAGSIGVCWWYTKSSFRALESIASMIVESMDEFANCDLDSVEEAIKTTLKEICVDRRIFATDDVCFARKPTLFDCRIGTSPALFGSLILDECIANLKHAVTRRCTVFVAPRTKGGTFQIQSTGVSAINREDTAAWQTIVQKGYQTDGWNPATGSFSDGRDSVFSKLKYDYVFLCEGYGTQKGSRFASSLKLRVLFSVLFAVVSARKIGRLLKSAADPPQLCVQFSAASARDGSITMGSIGSLVPYYVDEHVLTPDDIGTMQAWFTSINGLMIEDASRVEKGAHFINKAMNSDDIESYVNYFVALDALFGERGSVESSILAGVKSLGLDPSIEDRTPWLFDLRNELVHGGSRFIKEWPKYLRYYRHFDTTPDHDIEKLAFSALLRAPKHFAAKLG